MFKQARSLRIRFMLCCMLPTRDASPTELAVLPSLAHIGKSKKNKHSLCSSPIKH